MPRKRMLDPSVWEDITIGTLSRDARLCFIGLISHADDDGRVQVDPRYIKRAIFGFDDDLGVTQVAGVLEELRCVVPNLLFYTVGDRALAVFTNWRRYQYIQKPQRSTLPPPPVLPQYDTDTLLVPEEYVTAPSRGEEHDDSVPLPVSPNRIEKNRNTNTPPPLINPARETAAPADDALPDDAEVSSSDLIETLIRDAKLRPRQAAWAVDQHIVASVGDAGACISFVVQSDAEKPGAVLWADYLKERRLPDVGEVESPRAQEDPAEFLRRVNQMDANYAQRRG